MSTSHTPVKRALLVGINKYRIPNADLNGCVNDVEGVWKALTESFDFDPDNIRVLTDERATKDGILSRLEWLLSGVKSGDELFLHFSCHGSQIRDRNNDELDDSLDELIVTHDHSWDDPLLDDQLHGLFKMLPQDAFLTVVVDSCHSGTMTRGLAGNPMEYKIRYLPPPFDIASRSMGRNLARRKVGAKNAPNGSDTQRHILLSGCRDDQTSADANFDGVWGGALTTHLLQVLKEHPDWDWNHIHTEVVQNIRNAGFSQEPQLSGMLSLRERVPFGGTQ